MNYEQKAKSEYAAWRAEEAGEPVDIPPGLYQAISSYGTARANLAIKARHGGLAETGQAQEEVAAALRAVAEEYTLAVRGREA